MQQSLILNQKPRGVSIFMTIVQMRQYYHAWLGGPHSRCGKGDLVPEWKRRL